MSSLDRLFMDVAVYNTRDDGSGPCRKYRPISPAAPRWLIAASRTSIFPVDLQEQEAGERSKRNVPGHTSELLLRAMPNCRAQADLDRAAEVLNGGKKVAILCGRGALDATDELEETGRKSGRADYQGSARQSGGTGRQPVILPAASACSAPNRHRMRLEELRYAADGRNIVSVHRILTQAGSGARRADRSRPGAHRAALSGGCGLSRRQPAHACRRYPDRLQRKKIAAFLEKAHDGMAEWWKLMEERGSRADQPMKPQVVAWELGKRLTDNAIVSCDSGTVATWFARQIRAQRGQKYSLSGNLASMANGLPYAIAAQIAYPERQSVGFVGDGGFSMLMAEFATAVKYRLADQSRRHQE